MPARTTRKVETLKQPGMYGDGEGLYLRIGPTGAKSWILRTTVYGKRPIGTIGTADVLKALSPIWTEKHETAKRLKQRLSTIFYRAKVAGHYAAENPVNGLKKALPTVKQRSEHLAAKSLDSFELKAIPKLNKVQVLELARCNWIERRENVIALGPRGTGKTHIALGLGLAACQKGMSVSFTTAAALVNELTKARDERRPLRVRKQVAGVKRLFAMISQCHEHGATLITSNLPFDERTETFGTERLTATWPVFAPPLTPVIGPGPSARDRSQPPAGPGQVRRQHLQGPFRPIPAHSHNQRPARRRGRSVRSAEWRRPSRGGPG